VVRESRTFFIRILLLFRLNEIVASATSSCDSGSRVVLDGKGPMIERDGIRAVALRTEQKQPLLAPSPRTT